MCLISPVFHKMVCSDFREHSERKIELGDQEETVMRRVLDLACGRPVQARDLADALALAAFAHRYQLTEVVAAVEQAVLVSLGVENCAELLIVSASACAVLPRATAAARSLALSQFEQVAKTSGFLGLEEEVLSELLDDDSLSASEEAIFEAIVEWTIAGRGPHHVAHGLLHKVRFALMDPVSLAAIESRCGAVAGGGREGCFLRTWPPWSDSSWRMRFGCSGSGQR